MNSVFDRAASMKRSRHGFTIVELLMVVGILAILLGLVTTAASSAMRQGREKRMSAMKQVLQSGLATYYARNGNWPPDGGKMDKLLDGDATPSSSQSVGDLYLLSETETTEAFRELVQKSVKSGTAPYLDVSGLFVATEGEASSGKGSGRDFRSAGKTGKKSTGGRQSKMEIGDMVFGYPDARSGHFRRYYIEYNFKGDSVRVLSYNDIYNSRGDPPYNRWWQFIQKFDNSSY